MKFCIFSAHFLPHLGGVEQFTYNMAKHLISVGHDVIIVTSYLEQEKEYEEMGQIKVYRLPVWNLLHGRFPVLKYSMQNRKIIAKIGREEIDGVIVNTRFYIHSYLGVCFAKKYDIPAIVIEHGTSHFTVNNKFLDMFGHLYEHFISWLVKKKCSNFYGVSQSCNEWLKHYNINAKGVLYNAVDLEQIEHNLHNNRQDYRKKYNIQPSEYIIVYAGRLVKEKGILKLLSAYDKLYSERQDIHLFIAGAGDLLDRVKEYNGKKNIYVLGKIDFEYVLSLLTCGDVFCLPTDYPEGFPTSVLEAAACKCAIVTTRMGGSKELITSKEYGIILEKNTPEEIYGEIHDLLGDRERLQTIENRCYERLTENFTWDKTAENIVDIFS